MINAPMAMSIIVQSSSKEIIFATRIHRGPAGSLILLYAGFLRVDDLLFLVTTPVLNEKVNSSAARALLQMGNYAAILGGCQMGECASLILFSCRITYSFSRNNVIKGCALKAGEKKTEAAQQAHVQKGVHASMAC